MSCLRSMAAHDFQSTTATASMASYSIAKMRYFDINRGYSSAPGRSRYGGGVSTHRLQFTAGIFLSLFDFLLFTLTSSSAPTDRNGSFWNRIYFADFLKNTPPSMTISEIVLGTPPPYSAVPLKNAGVVLMLKSSI
jgi:hypothetical protein